MDVVINLYTDVRAEIIFNINTNKCNKFSDDDVVMWR